MRMLCDYLSLELEWTAQPPIGIDIQCSPDAPQGWQYGQQQAFLRLWGDLQPLLTAGWVFEGGQDQAVC
jgi:hypothetical protein